MNATVLLQAAEPMPHLGFSIKTVLIFVALAAVLSMALRSRFNQPEQYSRQLLSSLLESNRAVLVAIDANWVSNRPPGRFTSLSMRRKLQQIGVATLHADFTEGSMEVRDLLVRHKSNSVPMYLLYFPGAESKPVNIPDSFELVYDEEAQGRLLSWIKDLLQKSTTRSFNSPNFE